MHSTNSLISIGVGIDTARYGHRVSFLRPDRQPAGKALTVLENHDGYTALQQRLEQLHRQHPQAHFHVRVDAAGQYANNLERFLRSLPLPMTISIGEPKRNKDYQKAHFPKRTNDDTESQAMARFAVVEQPNATPAIPAHMDLLREAAGRLQAQVKQSTQMVNRLHNLLARVFPELATLTRDISAGWVLQLLDKYPTAARIAQARLSSLDKIAYLTQDKARAIHEAAQQSVGSLQGKLAEELIRELVAQLRQSQVAEHRLRQLLLAAHAELPASGHVHLISIPGIGATTAAALTAKIVSIDRFETPEDLVGYFGIFPQEASSGVDPQGQPLPQGPMHMSHKGNDLVRAYLYNAAFSAIQHNPAVRALYRRLRAKGKRSDVAMGHCMRKLLHLVFAVWKTNMPFAPHHYHWKAEKSSADANAPATPSTVNDKAVGHKREQVPTEKVVTTASSSVKGAAPVVNGPAAAPAGASRAVNNTLSRPSIDFAFIRSQITLEQVLRHLGLFESLKGRAPQLRGCCPFHEGDRRRHTLSVHLAKNVYHCFQAECQAKGNTLDFWAAHHRVPVYEAALHLAETFHLLRTREEAPVQTPVSTRATSAVITANEP
jgi:transposase